MRSFSSSAQASSFLIWWRRWMAESVKHQQLKPLDARVNEDAESEQRSPTPTNIFDYQRSKTPQNQSWNRWINFQKVFKKCLRNCSHLWYKSMQSHQNKYSELGLLWFSPIVHLYNFIYIQIPWLPCGCWSPGHLGRARRPCAIATLSCRKWDRVVFWDLKANSLGGCFFEDFLWGCCGASERTQPDACT